MMSYCTGETRVEVATPSRRQPALAELSPGTSPPSLGQEQLRRGQQARPLRCCNPQCGAATHAPDSVPDTACNRSCEPADWGCMGRQSPEPQSRSTFGRSPVRESRTPESARGGRGNPVPYRYKLIAITSPNVLSLCSSSTGRLRASPPSTSI
jgi:hypothetical protein